MSNAFKSDTALELVFKLYILCPENEQRFEQAVTHGNTRAANPKKDGGLWAGS